jgi:hypothetical protein
MRTEFRYAISVASALTLATLALVPEQAWASMPSVCLWRNLLGIECLGCGMTRGLAAALHGRFDAALGFNAGVVLAGPALLLGALQGLRR